MSGPLASVALALLAVPAIGVPSPASRPAAAASPGQTAFRARCGGCHLDRGFGTRVLSRRVDPKVAQLEQRDDLTRDYVRTVVRNGLNAMPPLRKAELGDAELNAIAAYLAKGKRP